MKINNDIAPLVGYVILTVIFTYPVAFSSEEVFPGMEGMDTGMHGTSGG